MKQTFTFCLISAALIPGNIFADYISSGLKKAYTFSDLAMIENSGVTQNGNTFTISGNIEIAPGDTLRMDNNATILLGSDVCIFIKGFGDLCPPDTALVTRLNEEARPKGFYFNDEGAAGELKNICLEYAGLRYNGKKELSIDNCTFQYIGTTHSSIGAVALGDGGKTTVKKCRFVSNESSAIGFGANQQHALTFTDNHLYDNNTKNSNRPQINLGTSGNEVTLIARNYILGTQRNKVGGIAISNMLGMGGTNKAIVDNNYVSQCRYGLTFLGALDIEVKNNILIDNKYETDPNNGGSGISIYDSAKRMKAVITGNHIEKHLWGITILGGNDINIGKTNTTGEDYNPGKNIFIDNGNNGCLYDLYNNTSLTIYAQGNTWNVDEQTPEKIETVIFHKKDNPNLGEVIYQDVISGLQDTEQKDTVVYDRISHALRSSFTMNAVRIYDLKGAIVFDHADFNEMQLDIPSSIAGIHLVEIHTNGRVLRIKTVF
ncbi:MAG: hypothetical protein ACRCSQ_08730 [Bacteroidales bacterium]